MPGAGSGHSTVIQDVQSNAASNSPIHQLYRESLAEESAVALPNATAVAEISSDHKRKLEELEMKKLEVDIERVARSENTKSVWPCQAACEAYSTTTWPDSRPV